ncbi:hypothetical protein [Caldiplasma sukawensis]
MNKERLQEVAIRIKKSIKIPDFSFFETSNGQYVPVMQGDEISMYRHDEETIVLIDGRKIYFNERAVAKLYFFAAILAIKAIRFPSPEESGRLVSIVERAINSDRSVVMREIEKFEENERREIMDFLIKEDRYFLLLLYDYL